MPRFDTPPPLKSRKLLYLGHTGAGKTGSLCSLAAAGYNVHILDLDGSEQSPGCEIIYDFMLNTQRSIYRKAKEGLWTQEQADTVLDRIDFVSIPEQYSIIGSKSVTRGTAWKKINDTLNGWKDGDSSLGNIASWSPSDILVIDGLSRLAEAAMNFQLVLNGRAAQGPQVGGVGTNDYSAAYQLILNFLDLLKSGDIKCNVILICHIQFRNVTSGGDTQIGRGASAAAERLGFPQTVGSQLAPKIGQYFNHAIEATQIGAARRIVTNTSDSVLLKSAAPLRVKASYPLDTGLAEYFRDLALAGPQEALAPAEAEESETKKAAE